MKLRLLFVVPAVFCLLAGCSSIPVRDGAIPEEYARKIQDLAGPYKGDLVLTTFDGTVTASVLKDAGIELKITDKGVMTLLASQDWLGKNCGTQIGKLTQFRPLDRSDEFIFDAYFELDPGKCPEKAISRSLRAASRRGPDGIPYFETFLTKEYKANYARKSGARPLNYYGAFSRAKR